MNYFDEQMLAITLPKIIFNIWFWFALLAIVIVIHYFWGKTPPPPKPSKFLAKHKRTISIIMDIFLIAIILFGWLSILFMFFSQAFEPIFKPSPYIPSAEDLKHEFHILLIGAIPISGISGLLIGMLTIFQTNLTSTKRVILLGICLLPIVLSVLLVMIERWLGIWSTIKLGLGYSLNCWLINGPAIFIGKHFFPVSWNIMRKLRLVSVDYPG